MVIYATGVLRQVLLALERLQSANVGSAVVSFDRDFDKVQVDGLTLGAVEPSRQWRRG